MSQKYKKSYEIAQKIFAIFLPNISFAVVLYENKSESNIGSFYLINSFADINKRKLQVKGEQNAL